MGNKLIGYGISSIVLLLIWYGLSLLLKATLPPNQAFFLPTPIEAFEALFINWEHYLQHFWGTTYRLLIAMGVALVLAIPLGLFIGYHQGAKKYLTPFIYTIYPIPKVVFWPVLFLIVGAAWHYEDIAKITFIFLVVFFQLLVSIRDTAANMPKEYIVTALVSGVRPFQMYKDVLLPGALPEIFSSLRVSIGIALFAAYIAEASFRPETTAFAGLGYYIREAYPWNTKGMYAGILAIAILGLLLYFIVEILERRICRWKRLEIDESD